MTPEIFATKGILIFDDIIALNIFGPFQFVERLVVQHQHYPECKDFIYMPFTRYGDSLLECRGGMLAPLIGGALLMVNISFPVYASIIVFTAGGLCVLPLKASDIQWGSRGALH